MLSKTKLNIQTTIWLLQLLRWTPFSVVWSYFPFCLVEGIDAISGSGTDIFLYFSGIFILKERNFNVINKINKSIHFLVFFTLIHFYAPRKISGEHIEGLVQNYCKSLYKMRQLQQFCTKPSIQSIRLSVCRSVSRSVCPYVLFVSVP